MIARTSVIVALIALAGCSSKKEPVYKERTLTQWRAQLKAENTEERRAAADALREMNEAGTNVEPAVPDLVAALADTDDFTRIKVLDVFWALGTAGRPAVAEATRLLQTDANVEVRLRAVGVLGVIGPDGGDNLPGLIDGLRDKDAGVRCAAAKVMAGLEKAAVPAVPALIEALADKDDSVRVEAAYALAVMGKDAAAAVPALQQLKLSKHRPDVAAATHALAEIQKKN